MNFELKIFQLIVLIMSAIAHEYMHGWMADRLGDSTAKDEGRLTLNPIPHIDMFGSIVMPLLLLLSGSSFVFGWAKPVPFNPYNLRDKKFGISKVAFAGPLGNLMVAIFFGMILRFAHFGESALMVKALIEIIVYINLLLMVFNLVPIPPLDGSKVIMPFLPYNWQMKMANIERYGMIIVFLFVILAFQFLMPIINLLFKLIVGYF